MVVGVLRVEVHLPTEAGTPKALLRKAKPRGSPKEVSSPERVTTPCSVVGR